MIAVHSSISLTTELMKACFANAQPDKLSNDQAALTSARYPLYSIILANHLDAFLIPFASLPVHVLRVAIPQIKLKLTQCRQEPLCPV